MPNTGIRFRELMKGWVSVAERDFTDSGAAWLELRADIFIEDLNAFLADKSHRGQLIGQVDFDPFGHHIPAAGHVELFTKSADSATRLMKYHAAFVVHGIEYKMVGTKHVARARGPNVWGHTTTLFTTILRKQSDHYASVAGGVIRLSVLQAIRMLFTLRGTGSDPLPNRVKRVFRFAWFFVSEVSATYFLYSR